MSNTNNNLQSQTSNALHNAIMEAGGKDRPPMLATGNYVQWKSRIKRYIDTKPNNELIHYCLQNPPYKFKWTEKTVLVTEGSSETTTEGFMENYKNVSQDIRNQLDAEAEAVQIILTGIYNDIYSTVDACPNACEMWKVIERNKGKAIVNSPLPTYDQEPTMVAEDDEMSKEKEIDKLMALNSLSFKKIYKPTNNNLRNSSNTPVEHIRIIFQELTEELANWRDDTDDEPEDQDLEAHYLYMTQIQEVTPDAAENFGPIFDAEPLQKVHNDDDNYNVFANDREHPEQPESVNDTYMEEQGDTNITIDSLDMSTNGETVDQDDDDLAKERDLLASLIDKLKCEINDNKKCNKLLESSNKTLVDKLKDLKAQLQDKDIAISELKKLIEMMKGKSVETKFEKPLVIRQPNDFKSQRQSVLVIAQILPQNVKSILKNTNVIAPRIVIPTTSVSKPQLKSNQWEDRVMHNNSEGKNQQVEDHHRNFKFSNNKKYVTACTDSLNAKTLNVNFVCVTYGKYVLNYNHDMCVLHYINGINSKTKMHMDVPISTREPKRTVNQSVATPLRRTVASESTNQKPKSKLRKQYEQISKTCKWWYSKITPPGYKWKPKTSTVNVKPNVSMPLGNKSRTTTILEPMTLRKSTISNNPSSSNSFADHRDNSIYHRLWFVDDQIAPILGYGDLVQGNITIKKVYYVEGLNHNLFSIGQFCDADLEVAFLKSTFYIRDLKGNDLLT
ncbi:hypothetical protein Tco_0710861, partial [Tanacetum coccineum]